MGSAWWGRTARLNLTNSLFAWNWVGMTNHHPYGLFCAREDSPENLGLANHIIDSLFIGHGDDRVNAQLCAHGEQAQGVSESPSAIRQYDGAFWLTNCRWTNMTTIACPTEANSKIQSLPHAVVAARQTDCNAHLPIELYESWPLGAHPKDAQGTWAWALRILEPQNLVQFSGSAACNKTGKLERPDGSVTDISGTLDPQRRSPFTAYVPVMGQPENPGQLAERTVE